MQGGGVRRGQHAGRVGWCVWGVGCYTPALTYFAPKPQPPINSPQAPTSPPNPNEAPYPALSCRRQCPVGCITVPCRVYHSVVITTVQYRPQAAAQPPCTRPPPRPAQAPPHMAQTPARLPHVLHAFICRVRMLSTVSVCSSARSSVGSSTLSARTRDSMSDSSWTACSRRPDSSTTNLGSL